MAVNRDVCVHIIGPPSSHSYQQFLYQIAGMALILLKVLKKSAIKNRLCLEVSDLQSVEQIRSTNASILGREVGCRCRQTAIRLKKEKVNN